MTYILGIDPGLESAGWALIDEHGALDSFACVETSASGKVGDNQRRLAALLKAIAIPMRKASVIGIEFPTIGIGPTNGNDNRARWSAKSMGQTVAAASVVMGAAFMLGGGRRIFTPAPITWRCSIGDGDSDEEDIHAALAARYPLIADMRKGARPHVYDALGVALYTRQFVSQPETQETAA